MRRLGKMISMTKDIKRKHSTMSKKENAIYIQRSHFQEVTHTGKIITTSEVVCKGAGSEPTAGSSDQSPTLEKTSLQNIWNWSPVGLAYGRVRGLQNKDFPLKVLKNLVALSETAPGQLFEKMRVRPMLNLMSFSDSPRNTWDCP